MKRRFVLVCASGFLLAGSLCLRQWRQPPTGGAPLNATEQSTEVWQGAESAAAAPEQWSLPGLVPTQSTAGESPEGADRLQQPIEVLAEDYPAEIKNEIGRTGGFADQDCLECLVGRWAERDPAAAALWACGLPEGKARQNAIEQVAMAWANSDAVAAISWAYSLPEGISPSVFLALGYEAARTEPAKALELASHLPATAERDNLLLHAFSQWVLDDGPAASSWALQLPESDLREKMLGALAVELAEHSAVAAGALAAQALQAGAEQDRAAVAIVQRWAQAAPQEAASWVSQFPDNPARVAAAENLLSVWRTYDAQAAQTWLEQIPEGPLRDAFSMPGLSENVFNGPTFDEHGTARTRKL